MRTSDLLESKRGTAAIEFAIIAPIFLMLLFGMIAYGIYFGAAHSVQQLTADAARTAIAGLDNDEREYLVSSFVENNAGNYTFLSVDEVDFIVQENPTDANQFTVRVSYDARHLPIWNIFAGLPLPETTILRTTTIRIGGI